MTDATAAEPTGGQTRDLSGARDMIVCEGVSKWYGDFQALDKVSATIKEQEVVVVLGPSGSGKSTWIRCINRLEIHQEGRIVVDDVELTNDLRNIEKVRSEVGMVFQQFNLFPHLTILDNVTLAPIWVRKKPRAEAESQAMSLLERVGIPEQAHKYPGQLSGGQQQRVAIARALAARPRILLLDEPFSNIDAAQRVHIRQEIIAALRTLETTVIWVTHDQEEALLVADRVAFMIDGEIKQIDSPEHIYMYPETLEAAEFIGEGVAFLSEIRSDQITSIFGDLPISECATESNRLEIDQSSSAILFVRPEQRTLEPDLQLQPQI